MSYVVVNNEFYLGNGEVEQTEDAVEKKDYLGDGLYVEDYGMIRLYTDRGADRHEVFLEDEVLLAFFRFIERARNVTITIKTLVPVTNNEQEEPI